MSQANPNQGPAPRPGQMTMAMQAIRSPAMPKVLRLCLVNQGKVLEERILKQRSTVTVGSHGSSMFVVNNKVLGQNFKLFELVAGEYMLNFTDEMRGRVALPSGVSELGELRGRAKRVGSHYQVRLSDDARGRIVAGDTTFLFQFVTPPPVTPKPQLPLSVTSGLSNSIDWTLTILAALSFLLHFGFVGALYSDWMDRPIPTDTVSGMVDLVKRIQPPPVEEKPAETPTESTTETPTESTKPSETTTKPSAGGGKAGGGPSGGQGGGGNVSDARAAALARQAANVEMQILGAFGGGSSMSGTLSKGEVAAVGLDKAAASAAGANAGGGDLRTGSGGGVVAAGTGAGTGGLAGVGGGTGKSEGSGKAGSETKVAGPSGNATVGAASATVPVTGADRVIAGMRTRFKNCYQTGLATDPSMSGKVVLSARVGPNGEVSAVTVGSNSGLSPSVVSCLQGVVKRGQFDPPGGTGSTLSIPISFVQQK